MATGTLTAALTVGVPADRTERYVTYYGDLTVSAVGDTYATGESHARSGSRVSTTRICPSA